MYTLEAILERLRAYKPELQRKYPISRLGLFGSYARGEATENSDIDVAVELSGPMGLNFVAMANEIEDLFGTKVDVVPKRSINPVYLASIEKDILYV
jgi:predicted nucleotidyltransferase